MSYTESEHNLAEAAKDVTDAQEYLDRLGVNLNQAIDRLNALPTKYSETLSEIVANQSVDGAWGILNARRVNIVTDYQALQSQLEALKAQYDIITG